MALATAAPKAANAAKTGRNTQSSATVGIAGAGTTAASGPRYVDQALGKMRAKSGQALQGSHSEKYEAQFNRSFADVRIHNDPESRVMTRMLGAQAVTVGNHVALGPDVSLASQKGEAILAHELAHVVQQEGATASATYSATSAGHEAEAQAAGQAALAGRKPGRLTPETGAKYAMQQAPEGEAQGLSPEVANAPMRLWVDAYTEIFYDMDYRPAQPGHLSKWLRVSYSDGTLIDINIDEISDADLSPAEFSAAISNTTIGRGGRLTPGVMNRQTTPRLHAAKRSAIEAMEQFNLNFMMATVPVVLFIITMPLGMTGGGAGGGGRGGGGPRATRRPFRRGSRGGTRTPTPTPAPQAGSTGAASGTSAAATQTAEQVGASIGQTVMQQARGRMAAIVEQISARGMSQNAAATATESAVRTLGLRVGPRTVLPNGNIVVTSVQVGRGQPVLVVRPDGTLFRATADLVLEGLELVARNITAL